MIGSILILTLAAFSLGAYVLARKYSKPDVVGQPETTPLASNTGPDGRQPGLGGPSAPSTPLSPVTTGGAPGDEREPTPPSGTSPPPELSTSSVSSPEMPASPEAVQEALRLAQERIGQADAERAKAKAAYDGKDYPKALEHNERCLTILNRLRDEATVPQVKSTFNDMVSSESNRRILFCYSAVDESDISNGISDSWKTDVESLTPPAKLVDGRDLCQQDWTVNVAYANGTVVALTPVSLHRYLRGAGLAALGGVLA